MAFFGLLFLAKPAAADERPVPVTVEQFRQTDDSVQLLLRFDLGALRLPAQHTLTLRPRLVAASGDTLRLPYLLVNGRQRQKDFLRGQTLGYDKPDPERLAVLSGKQVYLYKQTIGYEDWMRRARVEVLNERCDCDGKAALAQTVKPAGRLRGEGADLPRLRVAYLRPEAEAVKHRAETADIFLDFPLASTDIYPGFGRNPAELEKAEILLGELAGDKDVQVTGVHVTGYASPEGEEDYNFHLAQGRAVALAGFLSAHSGLPASLFRVTPGGEDWDGMLRLLPSGLSAQDAEAVKDILRYDAPGERKQQLKALDGGCLWQSLLDSVFPRLRRVESRIEYTVRGFDIEEALERLRSHPQQLSLNELFLVANTYPQGSADYRHVFETAVRYFPDDPVANLNAAAAALAAGQDRQAATYLKKARRGNAAYYNNVGVLLLRQGKAERGRHFLELAAGRNSQAAKDNLRKLQ
jgi:hypothetical protein